MIHRVKRTISNNRHRQEVLENGIWSLNTMKLIRNIILGIWVMALELLSELTIQETWYLSTVSLSHLETHIWWSSFQATLTSKLTRSFKKLHSNSWMDQRSINHSRLPSSTRSSKLVECHNVRLSSTTTPCPAFNVKSSTEFTIQIQTLTTIIL